MLAIFQRNQKAVLAAIKFLLYLSLLMPLLVSARFLFPFVFVKAVFFEALVELAAVLYLGLILADSEQLPRFNWLTKTIAFWLASIVLAGVFGVNFLNSFWSKAERMEGIFWYLHLGVFLLLLLAALRSEKDWHGFFQFNSLVALAAGGYALLGKYAPSVLPIELWDQTRLSGSFGNPAFLATYFVVVLFLNLYLFFAEQNKVKKPIWLFLISFALLMIAMSGTRGAYVGTLAGFFTFGFLGLFSGSKTQRKLAAGVLIALVFAGLSFFVFRDFWQSVFPTFSSRLYSIWQIPTQRLLVWQLGLKAFGERPVFGWGLENFMLAFGKHFNPEIFRYEVALFDRPHNKLIEVLVTTGGLGLAAYLSVFVALAFSLLKRFSQALKNKQAQQALLLSAVAGLWAAYFVQNLVLFEMPSSALVLFISLAFSSWLLFPPEQSALKNKQPDAARRALFEPGVQANLVYAAGVVLVAVSFFAGVMQPVSASGNLIKAVSYFQAPNVAGFLESGRSFYRQAKQADTFLNQEVILQTSRQLRSLALYPQVLGSQEYQDFLREFSNDLLHETARYQNDYELTIELANLASILEAKLGQPVEITTLDLTERAVALAPRRLEAYQTAFTFFVLTSQQELARQEADKLMALSDKVGIIWFYQAIYEARWGSVDKVLEYFQLAKQYGYDIRRLSEQENLLNAFLAHDNSAGALRYLDVLLQENFSFVERVRFQIIKIEILYKTGQVAAAKTLLQEVLAAVPEQERQGVLSYLRSRGVTIEP